MLDPNDQPRILLGFKLGTVEFWINTLSTQSNSSKILLNFMKNIIGAVHF